MFFGWPRRTAVRRMKTPCEWVGCLLVCLSLATSALAQPQLNLLEPPEQDGLPVRAIGAVDANGPFGFLPGEGAVPVARPGATMSRLTPADVRIGEVALANRYGDGGGADILEFTAMQSSYVGSDCEPPLGCSDPCNSVTLVWVEETENPGGVEVFRDGVSLGTVPGLDQVPGVNGVTLRNIPLGEHVFEVEDINLGTAAKATLEVIENAPFSDLTEFSVDAGVEGTPDGCQIAIDWVNGGVVPDRYVLVNEDGTIAADFLSGLPGLAINGVAPGDHCLRLAGLSVTESGTYRGCVAEDCLTLDCAQQDCAPPLFRWASQILYGKDSSNTVLFALQTRDPDSTRTTLLFEGRGVVAFPPNIALAFIGGFPAGTHPLGFRSTCPVRDSQSVEFEFDVRGRSPYRDPIVGDLSCSFDQDTSTATIDWVPDNPAEYIIAWIGADPRVGNGITGGNYLGGNVRGFDIENAAPGVPVFLAFVRWIDGGFYASELQECVIEAPPPPPARGMVRGVCDGNGGEPQISSAIFGLNYLFLGGDAPPCEAACDVNDDGAVNLTDMVRLLVFLFQGGPPPATWIDTNRDGLADPTCEEAPDSCLNAPACPIG